MPTNAPTADSNEGDQKFEFGPFRLDPEHKILWRDGQVLPLGPKVVHTLAILVARSGQVVSREELISQIWGDAVVEENSLAHNISVLRKSLKENASGGFTIETIPRRGYRFSRPAVIENQRSITVPSDSRPSDAAFATQRPRRWAGVAAALVALLCMVAVAAHLNGYRVFGKERRRSVAVVGFTNLSRQPDFAWMSPALAEMLSAELATGSKLLTIPGENVARARAELQLDDRDGFSAETSKRLRKDLDADLVVSGAYAVVPHAGARTSESQVRLDLRIQDASSGELLDTISEIGEQSSLFDLIARAGIQLRQDLGASALTPEQAAQTRSAVTSNPRALRLYAQGIERLRSFDAIGGREFLQQAIEIDPQYALAHSALAEAFGILGYSGKSADQARIAFELSGQLSHEERLIVEGRYRIAERDWKKAGEVYQQLVDLFPDNLEYGLRLASAQISGSHAREGLATLNSLRRMSQETGNDPRISLKEYEAWKVLGDFRHMEDSLAEAADNARKQGALLLLARARTRQCWVQRVRAEQERAISNCQEAQQIYAVAGDRGGEAAALRFLGDLVSSTDVPAAIAYYRQSLAIDQEIGDIGNQAVVISQLATEYSSQGDHVTAKNLYDRATTVFKELDDTLNVTGLLIDVGSELAAMGRMDEAQKAYEDAFASAGTIGNRYIEALALYDLGDLQRLRGDLDGAQKSYEQALARMREVGNKEYDIGLTKSLGEVAMAKGDFGGARTLYERAISMQDKTGQKISAIESELDLYQLSLEEGKPATDLEAQLRRVVDSLRNGNEIGGNNAANNQALSVAVLARCLLAKGQPAAALETIEQAVKIAGKAEPNLRLSIAVTAARIRFAAHQRHDQTPLENLKQTIMEARKLGYTSIELEGRLALGELEMKSGDHAGGRARVLGVEKDASRRGLLLLARKARAA